MKPDFVSFHRKGQGDVDSIIRDELTETIPRIYRALNDSEISIFNDEGDPDKSWWKPRKWRATVKYPALVARSITHFFPVPLVTIVVSTGSKLLVFGI
jgi:hypothetical protein